MMITIPKEALAVDPMLTTDLEASRKHILDGFTHEQWAEVVWRIFADLLYEDPRPIHFRAVHDALEHVEDGAYKANEKVRDEFAREVWRHGEDLLKALGVEWERSAGALRIKGPPAMPQEEDGMLWLDARFAAFLEHFGEAGREYSKKTRESGPDRWRSNNPRDTWRLWLDVDHDRPVPAKARFLSILAYVLWEEKVGREERQYAVLSVRRNGDDYCKVPKFSSGVSWAFGGAGKEIQIDGEKYAQAPRIARYVSRAVGVLPTTRRPAQQSLPIELHDVAPFALRAVGDTQYVLSPYDGKMFLFMLITCPLDGLARGTVEEITREMNPDKRRIQARDYEATVQSARNLRSVQVILPDLTDLRVFDIRAPTNPKEAIGKQPICWAYGPNLLMAVRQGELGILRGEFMMNFTGAMRLSGNEAPALRQYIFACALWNDARNPVTGQFDPDYLESFTIDGWAAATNTLSEAALDYLEERKPSRRRKLSRDRKRAREHLDRLAEEHSLVRVENTSRDKFKALPPESVLEAYDQHRKGGRRPKK